MKDTGILLSDCKIAGYGAYGKVYTGVYDGKRLATKRRYIVEHATVPPGCIHVNEVDVMCRIKHPHILHAITMQRQNPIPDSFKTDKLNPRGDNVGVTFRADLIYLICDAADGDLSAFSISNDAKVVDTDSEGVRVKDELRRYMWQVLTAIAYLHAKGQIHRDIKPSNILYFDDVDPNGKSDNGSNREKLIRNIRLCDFDMCLPEIGVFEASKAMTPEYTPPEVLVQGANVIYSPKVDIWGAGHVMYHLVKGESLIRRGKRSGMDLDYYVLATEKALFPNGKSVQIPSNLEDIVENIIRMDLEDVSIPFDLGDDEANDLLMHMLDCNPDTRWSAIQCLQHPFFQKKEIPKDHFPVLHNTDGDVLIDDHIIEKHYITEEMAQVFDSQIDRLSDNELFGFFLGLDILMRVCSKKYRGNGRNLAICCFNLGMKFYDKETAKFMRIDHEDAKRIEYNIISSHLGGRIYRDNIYNHICRDPIRVYRYLMAPDVPDGKSLLPNKLSTLIRVIRKALDL